MCAQHQQVGAGSKDEILQAAVSTKTRGRKGKRLIPDEGIQRPLATRSSEDLPHPVTVIAVPCVETGVAVYTLGAK